jgi:hypothetical protein
MSGFLENLTRRAHRTLPVLKPRPQSVFEPLASGEEPALLSLEEPLFEDEAGEGSSRVAPVRSERGPALAAPPQARSTEVQGGEEAQVEEGEAPSRIRPGPIAPAPRRSEKPPSPPVSVEKVPPAPSRMAATSRMAAPSHMAAPSYMAAPSLMVPALQGGSAGSAEAALLSPPAAPRARPGPESAGFDEQPPRPERAETPHRRRMDPRDSSRSEARPAPGTQPAPSTQSGPSIPSAPARGGLEAEPESRLSQPGREEQTPVTVQQAVRGAAPPSRVNSAAQPPAAAAGRSGPVPPAPRAAAPAPVVVSIGTLEVRAVTEPAARRPERTATRAPALSLDEYLRRKTEGQS